MADTTPSGPPKYRNSVDIPVSNPDNVASVYSNSIGLSATATDVTLIFNELGLAFSNGEQLQTQEVKAIVTLAYPVASGLIQSLQKVMAMRVEMQQEQKKQSEARKAQSSGQ